MPDVRQRRQGAVALLRSRSPLRRLRVVRLLRVGPRPALPASPSGPPRHASPSSAPFPPVLHGGSAAPPASPPRGPFLIASRHSSRLYRHLSVCRRPWLPARPPLLASARLFKTPTSARRPCRAGILASTPIPLPNPGVQWTRTASLCSPLTPAVSHRLPPRVRRAARASPAGPEHLRRPTRSEGRARPAIPSVQRHFVAKVRRRGSMRWPCLSSGRCVAESCEDREKAPHRFPGPGFWLGASASWLHADVSFLIHV